MKGTVNGSSTAAPGRAAGGQRRPRFLQDKLQVPAQSFAVLRRDRVSRLLDGAVRHRVTLVCAPAGAGKTVACACWAAAGAASGQVAWLTLDDGDRHDWFWAYVGAALSRAPAAPEPAMRSLADTSPERFPLRLVEAAQGFSQPLVLVLDDVHEVTDERVLAGLDVLIRHAPPGLRLILLARRPPALQLARLRVAGELADIRASDLACTADEADAYFALLGMRVAAAERNEVLRRTEGWMAGLRLAAMRAGADGAGEGGITALAGDEPLVTDYLWDEVLARQEPATRDFLVRTSVCAELSGELADALAGGSGGGSLLSRLSRDNSFVTGPSGDAGTYRYHPLLREVLTAQLRRELGPEIPGLLGRAARWYAGAGRPLDAVRCAAAAGDRELAALVLAEAGAGAVLGAGPAELESVLALLPPDLTASDTAVAAAWAIARLWGGDRAGAAGYLEHARRALGRADPARRRIMAPTLAALQIMSAAGHDHGEERAAAPRQSAAGAGAPPVTGGEHRAAGLLWFARGVTRLARWEPAGARDELCHADRHLGAGGLAVLQARARAWRALALACCGELGAAGQAAGEVRQPGDPAAREAASLAALACAQISLARDDLLAARQLLDEAEQSRPVPVPGEPPAAAIAQFLRAKVLLAGGDPTAARSLLSRLRETYGPACPSLLRAVTVAEAEAALRAGDTGRARALLLLADGAGAPRGDATLVEGGLRLACGEFAEATEAVAPYLEQPGHAGPTAGTAAERAGALLVAAVARRRLGDAPGAAEVLETALGLAEPEEAYRLFLDGGGCVRSAVTLLVPPTSRHAGFAGRILERFDTQGSRVASTGGPTGARLTESERAVLCFLPSHMTNEEISQALFLSVNTVKTHLRAAYRKLGVRSRREAIAQGRRLGLL